jgi:hypothetical protein
MGDINYEVNNLLFPFKYGIQHFKIACSKEHVEWKGRVVHFVLGVLEMMPLVNYIIAIVDRIFHPKWLWNVITSEIDFDKLPTYDQSDIDFPQNNVRLPGIGIGIPKREVFLHGCGDAMQLPHYKWFDFLEKDDYTHWNSLIRSRNITIINRMTHPMMKGLDVHGLPMLLIARPTTRPEKVWESSLLRQKMTRSYIGNEVSIIFSNGTCISMCADTSGDCFSKISRLPEASPGLIDFVKK